MIPELISAAASVKALNDILKASFDLHTFNQVTTALSKVNADLMNAQAAALKAQGEQAQLAEKVRELESQLAAAARWESVSQKYKLRALVPEVYVYEYVATAWDSEPSHFACPNCFQQRERSSLQLRNSSDRAKWYQCLRCQTTLRADNPDYQPPTYDAPSASGPYGWMG
jgi:hypothetical protein